MSAESKSLPDVAGSYHSRSLNARHDPIHWTPLKGLMTEPVDPLIGRQLGAYRITTRIGAGGMGEVYGARDTRLQRDVAVKVLPAAFALHESPVCSGK